LTTPGARKRGVAWTDASGACWLFGGRGFATTSNEGCLNDRWKFDSGQWTWVSGTNGVDHLGSYGTQGVAAPSNLPRSREEPVSWMDDAGNAWIFGGRGAGFSPLNDLWKFDGSNWIWVSGSSSANAV